MGFARGFEAGTALGDRIGARRAAAEEQRQKEMQAKAEAANKAIDQGLTSLQEIAAHQAQTGNMDDPKFQETFSTIHNQIKSTAAMYQKLGLETVTTPEVIDMRAIAFLRQPTQEQKDVATQKTAAAQAEGTQRGTEAGKPVERVHIVNSDDDTNRQLGLNIPAGMSAKVKLKVVDGKMFGDIEGQPFPTQPEGDKTKLKGKVAIDTTGKGKPINVNYNEETGQYMMLDGQPMPAGYVATTSAQLTGSAEDLTGMTTPVQSEVQKDVIAASDRLNQLENISRQFDKDYLRVPAKIRNSLLTVKDMFGTLGKKDKEFVEKYAMFQQDAIQIVNETINDLTGAAMGVQEAERLRKQVPDPENNSPTEYNAKLKNMIRTFKIVKSRKEFLLRNGLDADFSKEPTLTIAQYEQHIENTGKKLADAYKKSRPSASDAEVTKYVGQQLKQEFGL